MDAFTKDNTIKLNACFYRLPGRCNIELRRKFYYAE